MKKYKSLAERKLLWEPTNPLSFPLQAEAHRVQSADTATETEPLALTRAPPQLISED